MYLRQAKLAINMAKCYYSDNMLVKTTLRIKENLKKAAGKRAIDEGKSLQQLFNEALEDYISKNQAPTETKTVSDREFAKLLTKVNKEYGSALRKLAKL